MKKEIYAEDLLNRKRDINLFIPHDAVDPLIKVVVATCFIIYLAGVHNGKKQAA